MKKISFGFIIFFMILLMTSCRSIDVKSSIKINPNESGDIRFKLLYDGMLASKAIHHKGILKENQFLGVKCDQTKRYVENNKHVEEMIINFNSIEDFNKRFSNNNSELQMNITSKRGIFKNIYSLEMRFPRGIDTEKLKSEFNGDDKRKETEVFNDDINIENFIRFTNVAQIPGDVIATNAIENLKEEKNTNVLTWNNTLGQITPGTTYTVTYQLISKTNIIFTIIIGVILSSTLLIYILKSKKVI